jgi:uncharacterized protein (DUF4415 family)
MSRDPIPARLRRLPEPALDDPDSPELTEADFAAMRPAEALLPPGVLAQFPRSRGRPRVTAPKAHVSLRLAPDVLAHYRSMGKGWQTRIEAVLRAEMETGDRS